MVIIWSVKRVSQFSSLCTKSGNFWFSVIFAELWECITFYSQLRFPNPSYGFEAWNPIFQMSLTSIVFENFMLVKSKAKDCHFVHCFELGVRCLFVLCIWKFLLYWYFSGVLSLVYWLCYLHLCMTNVEYNSNFTICLCMYLYSRLRCGRRCWWLSLRKKLSMTYRLLKVGFDGVYFILLMCELFELFGIVWNWLLYMLDIWLGGIWSLD